MSEKKVKIEEISIWMHRNCRELELARWKYLFEGGDKIEVVNALMRFQNEDGGFGHAVDPDNWNKNSLPYGTYFALQILKEIDFYDMKHPIYVGIKEYLDVNSHFPDGWVFTVPSNEEYPHASYYNYGEEYNKTESKGIIMGFCTFIIEHYQTSPLFNRMLEIATFFLKDIYSDNQGDMGITGLILLVNALKKAGVTGYDYERIEQRLVEMVNHSIQRDPKEWNSYGYRPSDYIRTADSIFYPGNEEIVEAELDFLVDTLPENDIWPVAWSWFENSQKYPLEYTISNHWDKAYKAIEKMLFLREFGKAE